MLLVSWPLRPGERKSGRASSLRQHDGFKRRPGQGTHALPAGMPPPSAAGRRDSRRPHGVPRDAGLEPYRPA